MSPYKHSEISVNKRGGKISDYYPIHFFLDSTKEICSDNRHRILHTLWGIRRVVIPVFGSILINSDNKKVNVKDLCEEDHVLPDYRNKFIPTLSDFVDCINENEIKDWRRKIEIINDLYRNNNEVQKILISPLSITGKVKSLLITHNSWFVNEIIPQFYKVDPEIAEFPLSPVDFFETMEYKLWMDNGSDYPPSVKNMKIKKQ